MTTQPATRACALCGGPSAGSVCTSCACDLRFLGVEPPAPHATADEVRAWAKANKVTAFRCNPKETP